MTHPAIPTSASSDDTLRMPVSTAGALAEASTFPPAFDLAGDSQRGTARTRNEDRYAICELDRAVRVRMTGAAGEPDVRGLSAMQGLLLAVADGMGGHPAGDVASGVVIGSFVDQVLHRMPWASAESPRDLVVDALSQAIDASQRRLELVSEGIAPGQRRPGTTLTAAYVVWPVVYVAHIGDSRCYLVRDGVLQPLTRDHTVASSRADRVVDRVGRDAEPSQVLSNAMVGDGRAPMADLRRVVLDHGDGLILCSDGVHGTLDDDDMLAVVAVAGTAREAAERLVARAVARGSRDDCTAVVARFHGVS